MDVTDEQRAVLSRELDRVLGTEATTIMMAHLPPGGQDHVATRQDIDELRAAIAKCATKDDLKGFATKDDLKRFATKEDLLGLVRREELSELNSRMDRRFDQVQQFHLELVERLTSMESRIEIMGQSIRAEIRGELVAAVTGQTKSLVISLMGALAIVSGLAFAIAANVQP